MQSFNTNIINVGLIIIIINIVVSISWFNLENKSLTKDSSDIGDQLALIRNEGYLIEYFSKIYSDDKIIFFGSSESDFNYSIPSQLNFMESKNLYENISRAWLSPIHLSLFFSKISNLNLSIPPIILAINPVYFTKAHNKVDKGGIGNVVKSSLYIKMNHRNVLTNLDDEVQNIFKKYFFFNNLMLPFNYQKYMLYLLHLSSYQSDFNWEGFLYNDQPYDFNHLIPDYNFNNNTWSGYKPIDQFMKSQWVIVNDNNSPNMIGLKSIFSTFEENKPLPVIIILLPTNFKYYESIDLDIEDYKKRDNMMRTEIKEMASLKDLTIVDLNENLKLNVGFRDRMHNDEYGFYQICEYLLNLKEYKEFKNLVRIYYKN